MVFSPLSDRHICYLMLRPLWGFLGFRLVWSFLSSCRKTLFELILFLLLFALTLCSPVSLRRSWFAETKSLPLKEDLCLLERLCHKELLALKEIGQVTLTRGSFFFGLPLAHLAARKVLPSSARGALCREAVGVRHGPRRGRCRPWVPSAARSAGAGGGCGRPRCAPSRRRARGQPGPSRPIAGLRRAAFA